MKGKQPKYRFSPNEEARLLKEEKERRRKLRIVQVREQAKVNAATIRKAVKDEKNRQIEKLAAEVLCTWEEEKAEKIRKMEEAYERSVKSVGEGHAEAEDVDPEGRSELRLILRQEQSRLAEERGREALKILREEVTAKEEVENRHIITRQTALEAEKLRASEIASLPPPKQDPLSELDQNIRSSSVKCIDLDAFSASHYHILDTVSVDRPADCEQVDAKAAASVEGTRYSEAEEEKRRQRTEQQEKAWLRHKHALGKERLKIDYDHMLHELSDLQRADNVRRQKIVANLPKSVFVAPSQRLEEKQEQQATLERAFEDMYMAGTDYMGDLSLALDPHPPPETPAVTETLELSTVDGDLDEEEDVRKEDRETTAALSEDERKRSLLSNTTVSRSGLIDRSKTPDSGLKKLLDRIRHQREQHLSGSQNRSESSADTVTVASSDKCGDRTLTQYTITTDARTDDDDDASLSTGAVESTATPSSDGCGQQRKTQTRGEESLSEGTIVSGGSSSQQADDTLLHPMERAAKVRNQPQTEDLNISAYLSEQRAREAEQRSETERLKAETLRRQQQITEQKRALEARLKEIESKKKDLEIQMLSESAQHQQQMLDRTGSSGHLSEGPLDSDHGGMVPKNVAHQSSRFPLTSNDLSRSNQYTATSAGKSVQFQPSTEDLNQPSTSTDRRSVEFQRLHGDLSSQSNQYSRPSQTGESIGTSDADLASALNQSSSIGEDRVRRYQQRLLSRQHKDRHEQLREARLELERKAEELLRRANEDAISTHHFPNAPADHSGFAEAVQAPATLPGDISYSGRGQQSYPVSSYSQYAVTPASASQSYHERVTLSSSQAQSYPTDPYQTVGSQSQYQSGPTSISQFQQPPTSMNQYQPAGNQSSQYQTSTSRSHSYQASSNRFSELGHFWDIDPEKAPSDAGSADKFAGRSSLQSQQSTQYHPLPWEPPSSGSGGPIGGRGSSVSGVSTERDSLPQHLGHSSSMLASGHDRVRDEQVASRTSIHPFSSPPKAAPRYTTAPLSSQGGASATYSTAPAPSQPPPPDLASKVSIIDDLAEIRKQKMAILERQRRQRQELEEMRQQWQLSLNQPELNEVSLRVDQLRQESPQRPGGDTTQTSDEPTPIDLLNPNYFNQDDRGTEDLGGSFLQQSSSGHRVNTDHLGWPSPAEKSTSQLIQRSTQGPMSLGSLAPAPLAQPTSQSQFEISQRAGLSQHELSSQRASTSQGMSLSQGPLSTQGSKISQAPVSQTGSASLSQQQLRSRLASEEPFSPLTMSALAQRNDRESLSQHALSEQELSQYTMSTEQRSRLSEEQKSHLSEERRNVLSSQEHGSTLSQHELHEEGQRGSMSSKQNYPSVGSQYPSSRGTFHISELNKQHELHEEGQSGSISSKQTYPSGGSQYPSSRGTFHISELNKQHELHQEGQSGSISSKQTYPSVGSQYPSSRGTFHVSELNSPDLNDQQKQKERDEQQRLNEEYSQWHHHQGGLSDDHRLSSQRTGVSSSQEQSPLTTELLRSLSPSGEQEHLVEEQEEGSGQWRSTGGGYQLDLSTIQEHDTPPPAQMAAQRGLDADGRSSALGGGRATPPPAGATRKQQYPATPPTLVSQHPDSPPPPARRSPQGQQDMDADRTPTQSPTHQPGHDDLDLTPTQARIQQGLRGSRFTDSPPVRQGVWPGGAESEVRHTQDRGSPVHTKSGYRSSSTTEPVGKSTEDFLSAYQPLEMGITLDSTNSNRDGSDGLELRYRKLSGENVLDTDSDGADGHDQGASMAYPTRNWEAEFGKSDVSDKGAKRHGQEKTQTFKPSRNWQSDLAEFSVSSSDDSKGGSNDGFRRQMESEYSGLESRMKDVYAAVMKATGADHSTLSQHELESASSSKMGRSSSSGSRPSDASQRSKSKIPTSQMMANLDVIDSIFSLDRSQEDVQKKPPNGQKAAIYKHPKEITVDDMSEYRRRSSRSPTYQDNRSLPIDSSTPVKPTRTRSSMGRDLTQYPLTDKSASPTSLTQGPVHSQPASFRSGVASGESSPRSDEQSSAHPRSLTQHPMSSDLNSSEDAAAGATGKPCSDLGASTDISQYKIQPGNDSVRSIKSGEPDSESPLFHSTMDFGRGAGSSGHYAPHEMTSAARASGSSASYQPLTPHPNEASMAAPPGSPGRRSDPSARRGQGVSPPAYGSLAMAQSPTERSPPFVRFAAHNDVRLMSSRSSSEQPLSARSPDSSLGGSGGGGALGGQDELSERVEASLRRHEQLLAKSQQAWGGYQQLQQHPVGGVEHEESGITEEPSLTLVSNSSQSFLPSDSPSPHKNQPRAEHSPDHGPLSQHSMEQSSAAALSQHSFDQSNKSGSSLLSFEQHEQSVGLGGSGYSSSVGGHGPSPGTSVRRSYSPKRSMVEKVTVDVSPSTSAKWMSLQPDSDSPMSSGMTDHSSRLTESPVRGRSKSSEEKFAVLEPESDGMEGTDDYEGLSLAEAFARRRTDFEAASKRRQEEGKRRAQEKKAAGASSQAGHMGKTLASWKQSRALGGGSRAGGAAVTPSTSATSHSSAGGSDETTGPQQRKKQAKEMKERTTRLYSRSEEAKRKKEEEDRKKQYEANRQRARQFEKKLQEKRKKKQDPKK